MHAFRAIAVPAFSDNYIWLLADARDRVVVVDPGDAGPVRRALAEGLQPLAILLTHHHDDHIGGAAALQAEFDLPCYAPDDERIPDYATRVREGDRVVIEALGAGFDVLEVPGHTRSHIAFHGVGHLFCGDTLFSLGCGRMFEGHAAQMLASLERLAALPADSAVCCGHEYTEANGRFAAVAEPGNGERDDWLREVSARRADGRPSLPSSIAIERAANPFLRCGTPAVWRSARERLGREPTDRSEVFGALRAWKDEFRA